MNPRIIQYLNNTPELCVIDVTEVEGSATGNGHAYFRNSPWVSSDVLMSLMYDAEPVERGLVYAPDYPIWIFPDDYIQRLSKDLMKRIP